MSSDLLHCYQWKASNCFSPLTNLVREGDPWFEEEEEVFTEDPRVSDKEGCASQIGMMVLDAEYADGLQKCEFELLYLP